MFRCLRFPSVSLNTVIYILNISIVLLGLIVSGKNKKEAKKKAAISALAPLGINYEGEESSQ